MKVKAGKFKVKGDDAMAVAVVVGLFVLAYMVMGGEKKQNGGQPQPPTGNA
jgi:hypothetical protein